MSVAFLSKHSKIPCSHKTLYSTPNRSDEDFSLGRLHDCHCHESAVFPIHKTMIAMRLFSSSALSIRRHPKIAVAMSGGVDSSVVAYLLRQDYGTEDLLGVHMSNWEFEDDDTASSQKCWEQDWKDAQSVAQHLNIPLVHTSFQADYWNSVFEPYVNQIARYQTTPNPDVDCNRFIKFGVLREFLQTKYNVEILATGHYARIWDPRRKQPMPICLEEAVAKDPSLEVLLSKSAPTLLAARDTTKDQSYFLTGVAGTALQNVLFPLGDYLKTASTVNDTTSIPSVRELAAQANLPNAHKRDSMGICFVGKRKHADFVQDYLEAPSDRQPGRCINVEDGKVVTTFDPKAHPALLYATIGQGAKLGGATQKWFVVDKPDAVTLHICQGTHHPALYADSFQVDEFNWIAGVEPLLPLKAQCRIRHLQPLVDCEIRKSPDSRSYEIFTAKPLRGIASGQVCGVYVRNLICLGGGSISRRGPSYMELQRCLPEDLHPAGRNDLSAQSSKRKQSVQ